MGNNSVAIFFIIYLVSPTKNFSLSLNLITQLFSKVYINFSDSDQILSQKLKNKG